MQHYLLSTTHNFMLNVDDQLNIIYSYKIMVSGWFSHLKKKNQQRKCLKLSPKCGALFDLLYLGLAFQETQLSASRISSGGNWLLTNVHKPTSDCPHVVCSKTQYPELSTIWISIHIYISVKHVLLQLTPKLFYFLINPFQF